MGLATSPFRVDRDRIAASPFFARLAGVTQVVSPAGAGLLVHNRLTHSLQVAQVARAIAERVSCNPLVAKLGGCDPDVVEAAALAHDLGHPPFGHLGEQVLDRVARERLGLPDGFEGNAQSFRIVTTIDLHGPSGTGLDLTAAVRAAVLKYPWTRRDHPDPHPSGALLPPRGGGPLPGAPDAGSAAHPHKLNSTQLHNHPPTAHRNNSQHIINHHTHTHPRHDSTTLGLCSSNHHNN